MSLRSIVQDAYAKAQVKWLTMQYDFHDYRLGQVNTDLSLLYSLHQSDRLAYCVRLERKQSRIAESIRSRLIAGGANPQEHRIIRSRDREAERLRNIPAPSFGGTSQEERQKQEDAGQRYYDLF
jgi:hypothetical protein